MQQQIYFQPTEVPIGALVRFCIPGSDEPVDDIPALTCLLGGVPHRPKLYDLNGKMKTIFGECDKFVDGVRFVPAETYTAEIAPGEMKFLVYYESTWLNYEAYPRHRMLVTKLADGTFMSVCGYAYKHWLRRIELPEDACLISTGKCERTQTVDDATLLFVEPRSEAWTMLEEAGCTFQQESQGNFADIKPCHVWMPTGWHLEQNDRRFMGDDGQEFEIKDAKGTIHAHAIFFTWQGKKSGSVTIRKKANT